MLRLEASADAMGSTYSLVLYDEDRNKMEAASDDAFDEARRLDRLLSNYQPESEWSRVNREAAGASGRGFQGIVRPADGLRRLQPVKAKGRSTSRSAR